MSASHPPDYVFCLEFDFPPDRVARQIGNRPASARWNFGRWSDGTGEALRRELPPTRFPDDAYGFSGRPGWRRGASPPNCSGRVNASNCRSRPGSIGCLLKQRGDGRLAPMLLAKAVSPVKLLRRHSRRWNVGGNGCLPRPTASIPSEVPVLSMLLASVKRGPPNDDRIMIINSIAYWLTGGRGGIRTHGALAGTPVFKTGALNHSATLPAQRDQALSGSSLRTQCELGPKLVPKAIMSREIRPTGH